MSEINENAKINGGDVGKRLSEAQELLEAYFEESDKVTIAKFVMAEGGKQRLVDRKVCPPNGLSSTDLEGGNIYFKTAPYTGPFRYSLQLGSGDDYGDTRGVYLDIDVGEAHKTEKAKPPTVEAGAEIIPYFNNLGVFPYAVCTGGGLQLHFIFSEVLPEAVRKTVYAAAKFLGDRWAVQNGYGELDATGDRARLARLPGTFNVKTGKPRPVYFLARGRRLDVETFLEIATREGFTPKKAKSARAASPRRERQPAGESAPPSPALLAFIKKVLSNIPGDGYDYNVWLGIVNNVWALAGDKAEELLDGWTYDYHHTISDAEGSVAALAAIYHKYRKTPEELPYIPPEPLSFPNATYVSQRFLDVELPRTKFVLIKSGVGTGKSTFLADKLRNEKLLVVSHRIALVEQLARKFGTVCYRDIKGEIVGRRVATTLHSLDRVASQFDVIVLDEAEQIFSSLTRDANLLKNKINILSALLELIKNARTVILADAALGEASLAFVNFFKSAPDFSVSSVVNTYEYSPAAGKTVTFFKNKAAALKELYAVLEAKRPEDPPVLIACNTKATADLLFKTASKYGLKGYLLTSDNSASEEGQSLISALSKSQFDGDFLVYSPSLGTGVSLNFPATVAFFAENTPRAGNAVDCFQQIGRCRQPVRIFGWVDKKRYTNLETDPDVIFRRFEKSVQPDDFAANSEENALYAAIASEIIAASNRQHSNFGALLAGLFAEGGATVETLNWLGDAALLKELLAIKLEAKAQTVEDILNAEAVLDPTFEDRKNPELRAGIIKGALCRLYGVSPKELTREQIEARDTIREYSKRYACVISNAYAETIDRCERGYINRSLVPRFAPDRTNAVKLNRIVNGLLESAGLELREGAKVGDLTAFVKFVEERKDDVEAVFGIKVRKDLATNPQKSLSDFLARIGVSFRCTRSRKGRQYYIGPLKLLEQAARVKIAELENIRLVGRLFNEPKEEIILTSDVFTDPKYDWIFDVFNVVESGYICERGKLEKYAPRPVEAAVV